MDPDSSALPLISFGQAGAVDLFSSERCPLQSFSATALTRDLTLCDLKEQSWTVLQATNSK